MNALTKDIWSVILLNIDDLKSFAMVSRVCTICAIASRLTRTRFADKMMKTDLCSFRCNQCCYQSYLPTRNSLLHGPCRFNDNNTQWYSFGKRLNITVVDEPDYKKALQAYRWK